MAEKAEGILAIFSSLGIKEFDRGASTGEKWLPTRDAKIKSISPVNGNLLAEIPGADSESYDKVIEKAELAFDEWRSVPAPQRGQVIGRINQKLRENKKALGTLISWEMGKPIQESYGEVQEMIDIADFAVGISRQLYGLSMHSERPGHRMYEQYHPLGIVGLITAFNFPVAVWAWNAMIAWVCGNVCVWKPSDKVPLTAIACQKLIAGVFRQSGFPEGISNLLIADHRIGARMAEDKRIPLISATGSTRMGKSVATAVGKRLGKTILELGGNNAIIISQEADLEIAIPSVVFGAVGTAGQRCTTTRRLIIQESIYEKVKTKLVNAYAQLKVGNPLEEENHMGPLIDREAVEGFLKALRKIEEEGGIPLVKGEVLKGGNYESGCYVSPAIYEVEDSFSIVKEETFAPITYIMKYDDLEKAIEIQNSVPQGLSSAIMTNNLRESELFLSHEGSDCGIANVNIGTSGAEIGGAFGGEKETGGGREAGSDAWKGYMRRQTNTINYSKDLPLAQGIKFNI